ncbi:MAG: hypothetical protein SGBAC_013264 [Bacillariaceae sp.]
MLETWTKPSAHNFKTSNWKNIFSIFTSRGHETPNTPTLIMPLLQIHPFSPAAFDKALEQSLLFNNADTLKARCSKKPKRTWQPTSVHVQRDEKSYSIFVDVPGVKQEDMHMQVTDKNQTLVLSGTRKFHTTGRENKEDIEEAKFERHFNIGHDVNVEKITADLADGVLKITAPKKEAPSPVTIPIQIGPKD